MSKLKANMHTIQKLFPELYGFVKGEWYEHIHSGSHAIYLGLETSNVTLGINPMKPDNITDDPGRYHIAYKARWYAIDSKLHNDWQVITDTNSTIELFKKYFINLGYKIGTLITTPALKTPHVITDDWYFDEDSLMVVCYALHDNSIITHIPLILNGVSNPIIIF